VTPADRFALATLAEHGWPTYAFGPDGMDAVYGAACGAVASHADVLFILPPELAGPDGHVVAYSAPLWPGDDPFTVDTVRWHRVGADPFDVMVALLHARLSALFSAPYDTPPECRPPFVDTRRWWTPIPPSPLIEVVPDAGS
jgi:hypothetical protein